LTQINSDGRPEGTLYFAAGVVLVSLFYYAYRAIKNPDSKRGLARLWIDQRVVVDGQLIMKNLVALVGFMLLYQLIQNLANLSLFSAQLANVNPGIITTIWSTNPLFSAIADAIFFKQTLKYFHYVGMFALIACGILISLRDIIYTQEAQPGAAPALPQILPAWVAVMSGIILTMCFTANQILCKHFKKEKQFDLNHLSYFTFGLSSMFLLVIAVVVWTNGSTQAFNPSSFLWGTLGSIINFVGKLCVQNAAANGPLGPAMAIVSTTSIFLIAVEVLFYNQILVLTDWIAIVLGLFGIFELIFPQVFEKLLRFNQGQH